MKNAALHVVFYLALSMTYGCSDTPATPDYDTDCPPDPTLPGCVDYCDDVDSTASWCGANVDAGDAGNAGTVDVGEDAGACGGGCASGVCDVDADACVECLVTADCDSGVCVEGATSADNVCAECADSADCTEAGAARCVAGATPAANVCAGCDASTQCAGIAGLEVCDVVAGECVECASDSDCVEGGTEFACDLRDNTCSDIEVGTATGCDPCVSNSSCAAGNFCVQLAYDGAPRGYYCMPEVEEQATMCPRPYGLGAEMRPTLGGEMQRVCLIKEQITTCEAIDQYEDSCPNGDECTADGSRCETVGGFPSCSYTCTGDRDCKTGIECGGDLGSEYCGG